jgi:threonine dehydrogenase-like Zn-dependent dehydrogenase
LKQRPAVIFECVGVPGVIQQIMNGAPAWARIIVVGVCMEVDRFEPVFGIAKQLNLQFVLGYMAELFAESSQHMPRARSTARR